jgi:predicted NAD/FAD-binding protein
VKVAVVGAGIAGLAATYLLSRAHDVTLFEAEGRLGGHAHTHVVTGGDGTWPIDTGFMVFNERTYPNFVRLLRQLGVESRPSDMSFGLRCRRCAVAFSSRGLRGLLAQPWRAADPRHLAMVRDMFRFFREGKRLLDQSSVASDPSLGEFLARGRYGRWFQRHFLLPMAGAIWSAPGRDIRAFPARSFLRFYENHGLLGVDDAPVWQTVAGGSRTYVEAIRARSRATFHTGVPVTAIRRCPGTAMLQTAAGTQTFDCVVIATHADQALALLHDPSDAERDALGRFRYSMNRAVLHSDESALPVRSAARASWNSEVDDCQDESAPASVTYDLTRLQGVGTTARYCLSLNRPRPVSHPIAEMHYAHPVLDGSAFEGQRLVAALNGQRHTFYCGAHLGYGFHEDGVVSALGVAAAFDLHL